MSRPGCSTEATTDWLAPQQHDRDFADAGKETVDEAKRRQIGPVEVIDHEQRRAMLSEVDREPVEAMQRR